MIEEDGSAAVDALLAYVETALCIGSFTVGEVSSAIARLVRMRHISQIDATVVLARFDAWRSTAALGMPCDDQMIVAATTLVRQFGLGLRLPDAIHAAACLRSGYRLVTFNTNLIAAANRFGIDVLLPN